MGLLELSGQLAADGEPGVRRMHCGLVLLTLVCMLRQYQYQIHEAIYV